MSYIKSPYIVELFYAFQSPDRLYFVMEFLIGGELFHHLRMERRFPEERTVFYSAEILLALECLHKNNIIYRDLKPENILMDSEGHVKITDFGLATTGDKATTIVGTPDYIAPEIIQGEGYGKGVDWWCFVKLVRTF